VELHRLVDQAYIGIVGNRKVLLAEPPICAHCGSLMQLRARHVQHARVVPDSHAEIAVVLSCPKCRREGAQLTRTRRGSGAAPGTHVLNVTRSGRRKAEDAARVVDQVGGQTGCCTTWHAASLTLRSLRPERRLALEMAVDERAEVEELERQWREAEEIAEIADGTLSTSEQLEEEMRA